MAEEKPLKERILDEFQKFKEDYGLFREIFYCEKDKNNGRINEDGTRNENRVKLFREAIREWRVENNDYDFQKFIFPEFGKKPKLEKDYAFWKGYGINHNIDTSLEGNIIDFTGAKFKGNVDFCKCRFLGQVFFGRTEFEDYANFNEAIFENNVTFQVTNFKGTANFSGVKILGDVKFEDTIFQKKVFLDKIKLGKNANISFEECVKTAELIKLKGEIKRIYIKEKLKGEIKKLLKRDGKKLKEEKNNFEKKIKEIKEKIKIGKEKNPIKLSFERTEINNQFIFKDIYLGRTSFLHSHISCTNFFNCEWASIEEESSIANKIITLVLIVFSSIRIFIIGRMIRNDTFLNKIIIGCLVGIGLYVLIFIFIKEYLKKFKVKREGFDDKFIFGNSELEKEKKLKAMEKVYRQFKKAFEDLKDWQLAGDFFIGEMEMRKQILENKKELINMELIFLKSYKFISFYGERFQETLLLYFSIIILAPRMMLLFSQKQTIDYSCVKNFIKDPSNYREALSLTFRSMTFQKDSGFENYSFAVKNIITIEFVVGTILLGILLLAIRRKFRR